MHKSKDVEEIILQMKEYCDSSKGNWKKLKNILESYLKLGHHKHTKYLSSSVLNIVRTSSLSNLEYYYILSFLFQVSDDKEIYKTLLNFTIQDSVTKKETKYFLYNQYIRYNFLHAHIIDEEIDDLLDDLYDCIYQCYLKELKEKLFYIPKEERNSDFVMVFTSQVLEMAHGPTKTLLDRCNVLVEYMQKNIYIINTAELLTRYQAIPYYNACIANYIESYSEIAYLGYKDKQFPFFQCPNEMPQSSIISEILEIVKSEKPYFIVTIGGNSIVSDICSKIVPTLAVGTVPSERVQTRGCFQVIGRQITEQDKRWLNKHHFSNDHMIEGLFTFAFKEQTHLYTRRQLGIPDGRFAAVVVGGRLDEEIDAEFSRLLERLISDNIFIVFMGTFDTYDEFIKGEDRLEKNSLYLGFQDDVLAVYECCDLYMNPKRIGGGTSAAEALYKGLPVVTLNYGDVGIGTAGEFHVASYEEMYHEVIRYASDKEYYEQKSKKARARAEYLMDSKVWFDRIIRQMENSSMF